MTARGTLWSVSEIRDKKAPAVWREHLRRRRVLFDLRRGEAFFRVPKNASPLQ